ncbi:heme-binding protein soul2 [Esox lucius]|uniref:Heme-binding protein 2 n=1 Tax=Esox lucius TaxID=8010 RepID=A0A3P8Y4G0_ESOLU|nr:heme-binding protein soul2 [Esox lucius]
MKYSALTSVSSLLVVVILHLAHGWDAPWFCHGYECPEFTVVNTYEDFEEREYKGCRWITSDSASDSDSDLKAAFTNLWDYTQGNNQAGGILNAHTWPALVTTTEVRERREKNVSVSFLVATENVILPTPNALIREETMPASTIYVRSFSSLSSRYTVQDNLDKLRNALALAGKSFNTYQYTMAAYENPWTLIDRHDEVWIHAA